MIHEIRRLNELKVENKILTDELSNQSSNLFNLQKNVYLKQREVDDNMSSMQLEIDKLKGIKVSM